ncbi:MAG TPA: hypothetical protein PKI62_11525 [bacterium]|nr:hypothetical protein [bacterium]HPR88021.1 hypothetical protein [bacterium]
MQKTLFVLFVLIGAAFAQQPPIPPGLAAAAGPDSLNVHLQALKPYLNQTWKGTFVGEAGAPPMHDVMRWERILNGQAIRILHSVNDGIYGGETILYWDKARNSLAYSYFTTAGFSTHGTMTGEAGKWVSHETVENNANGITEVRSTSALRPDGSLHNAAEFLQNGTWVPGHTIDYVADPEARILFR